MMMMMNTVVTGWFVTVSQSPAEVCLKDLAWDYPGVYVQVNAFIHSFNTVVNLSLRFCFVLVPVF